MTYRRFGRVLLSAAALLFAAAGCGGEEETASTGPIVTIDVDMVDNAFKPERVTVKDGDRVAFMFNNVGTVTHEAYVGTKEAQDAHAESMKNADADHAHGDAEGDSIEVAPGDTGKLTHTFRRGETVEIGCHVPGHYESGMKMTIEVT